MFQRAITLVKALSSMCSWYSSGPMTPRMWNAPSLSRTARLAQKRAVSSRISAPASRRNAVVAGGLPVLPDGVGDVGADVLLLPAAQDLDRPAVGVDDLLGRRLVAGVGRFPGVERAAVAHPRRLGAGPRQRVIAVQQQRPRRLRPGQDVERQQIDLGIPEDVARGTRRRSARARRSRRARRPDWRR